MAQFSTVYSLGDSLIDAGNALALAEWYDGLPLQDLPEGAPTAELGYFMGRFSDGYTFADLVTNKYVGSPSQPVFPYGYEDPVFGLPIAPFASDPSGNNLNFAYGGAQIRQGSEAVPDLDGQTDALRDAVDNEIAPGSLIFVTIGGNDVRDLVPASSDPEDQASAHEDLQRSAAELLEEMEQLVSRGATDIFLTGIPDVGLMPRYDLDGNGVFDSTPADGMTVSEADRSAAATEYSAYLDTLIRTDVIPALEALGASVTYVPIADIKAEDGTVLQQGALSRILPTIAALNGMTASELTANWLANQDLIFFDQVHPNAQAHALVSSLIHAELENAPWVETMPLASSDTLFSAPGTIGMAGEIDSFTVKLTTGVTYTFEALGVSTLGVAGSLADPALAILDSANGFIAAFGPDSGNDAGLGFDARFTFEVARTGIYTVQIAAEGTVAGDYLFQYGLAHDPAIATAYDFDGDGGSDVLMQRPGDGALRVWDGDTGAFQQGFGNRAGATVEAVGSFNQNGTQDVLLRLDTGSLIALEGKNGAWIAGFGNGAERDVLAIGDFDGDGGEDILFHRQSDGLIYVADGDGGGLQTGFGQHGAEDVEAVGDFNASGTDDVLMRLTSGVLVAFDGETRALTRFGDRSGHEIVAIGDFDGDGASDVLLQRLSDGRLFSLDGESGTFQTAFGKHASGLVQAVGDIDGDTADDIVLVLADGTLSALSGITGAALATYGDRTSDALIALSDFDGDRGADLLLQNGLSGRLFAIDGESGADQTDFGFRPEDAVRMVSDLDADGAMDLVLDLTDSNAILWAVDGADGSQIAGYGARDSEILFADPMEWLGMAMLQTMVA